MPGRGRLRLRRRQSLGGGVWRTPAAGRLRHEHRVQGRGVRRSRHTEDELRYVRRRYLSADAARAIAVQIANATLTARSTELWGQRSTGVASDSTHVRAYDQNLFTEWHSRYGGRGVLTYWHVEELVAESPAAGFLAKSSPSASAIQALICDNVG
jgi:TnpA family transposase